MNLPTLIAGRRIVEIIQLCVEVNLPLLLSGSHGVGKTELFKAAAKAMGIGYICRDLSLMEPPDLVGMPFIGKDDSTHYAPPAFLPREGRGIFIIEELNRAPRYMLAPCLQLLTDRSLNDYKFPSGWIPMAAINPHGEGHHVAELDPALLSRFLQVQVEADPVEWGYWASTFGNVHPKIVEFVLRSPGIFASSETNPRAWTNLSKPLRAWESNGRDVDMLLTAAAGLVGETWSSAFYEYLGNDRSPLSAKEILRSYGRLRATFKSWMMNGKFDLAKASLRLLKQHLGNQRNFESVLADDSKRKHVRWFLGDLPADLRKDTKEWLATKGYDALNS